MFRSGAQHCPLDGGAIVEGSDPWPGRTIDERFTIESLIGVGGMGRVYRARHHRLEAPIAVKLLNGELAGERRTAERFAREARAAMRIRSPHVVFVHDLGELPPGIPFLTMEWIEGRALGALLGEKAKLEPQSVARLGQQLAKGLAAAHGQGVVHRDLKPDNVLIANLGGADVAKIVDFGLARILDEEGASELTTQGKVLGTPMYLSPEQAAGRPADSRSDLYALGALLYRARAGRPPFSGTPLELISQHISATPPPLGEEPIDRLIMSLLAKDPAQRPPTGKLVRLFGQLARGDGKLQLTTPAPADPPV
jgi:serine/threonine-protein kinase